MAFGSRTAGAAHERYHRLLKTAADPHEWAYAWHTELNRGDFPAARFIVGEIVEAQDALAAPKVDFDNTPSRRGVGPVAPHSDLNALLERDYCQRCRCGHHE